MTTADLHFHSTHSDGKHSVAWLAKTLEDARAGGLQLAVLTDHDGISSYEEFSKLTSPYWPSICASELSCSYDDPKTGLHKELHLLVYGFAPSDPYWVGQFQRFKEERRTRFLRICENFKNAGYPLDGEKLASKYGEILGRPHIADALVDAGVVRSREEAFKKFLYDGHKYNVKKWRFPLDEALARAKKEGLRTSLAHPGQYGIKEDLIKLWKDMGLDAVEIYHPRHSAQDTNYYRDVAKRLGLLTTGGSDFHTDETDRVSGNLPSVGRTVYPYEEAKNFFKPLWA